MSNRLAGSSSPYLLQHADNPVDWQPWGDEAFDEARRRDVPIFLSVGYSSCHWCHVMAHESFEDPDVAAQLNDAFVNVKVDREQRPDVDAVYMRAVQAMTGHGGWPMSVFLTPDGEPFFAGTYWPKDSRHGLPSFPQVVTAVREAWGERRDEVTGSASSIAATLAEHREASAAQAIDVSLVDDAARVVVERAWDRQLGGFGSAPKFPQAMTIEWLLARHVRTGDDEALAAALHALDAMARGGIHDQLAGGFARYATDAAWLVPHFEKMLYDNALLLSAYASAAAITGDATLERVAAGIADYLLTELRTQQGTFVAATDADSEGVEGRYFVWSHDEFVEVVAQVDADPSMWAEFLDVTPQGNWEGSNILHEPVPRARFAEERGIDLDGFEQRFEQVRAALLARRATRVPPGVDDKALTDWNALAVRGLVRAGTLLERPAWVAAAAETAERLHEQHVVDGALHHTSRAGEVQVPGFLEDHALLALADLELFQATGSAHWFERGVALATTAHERFHDDRDGGWFQTAEDADPLYFRPKDTWDNAVPAGTSVMVEVSLLLTGCTGDLAWRERAEEGVRLFQESARTMATGYGWLLRQIEALAAGPREVAIIGPDGAQREELASVARARPYPGTLVVVTDGSAADAVPLLRGRGPVDGSPAAYVCRDLACERPVTEAGQLHRLLAA